MVYLPLRDTKLLLRDPLIQVKNKHLLLRDANRLLRDSMLAILRCLLPYALIIKRFLIFKEQQSLKYSHIHFPC